MFQNYLKTALRNFWKNRTFSLINILGLALGMACSLLIMLWVYDEKSMDAFHRNKDHLFKMYTKQYYDGKIEAGYVTPGLLGEELKKAIPEIENATGLSWPQRNVFQVGDKIFRMKGYSASEDFFTMFTFPLKTGNARTALRSQSDITISENMAISLFGSAENAMGKLIRLEDCKNFMVSAVFKNPPKTSSLRFDYVLYWDHFMEQNEWLRDWTNNAPETFIVLRSDAKAELVEQKIRKFLDTYNKKQGASFRIELGMQKFTETYLNSNFSNGEVSGGRIEYVRIFSLVALFILMIACINFMNLTTAKSLKRSKEIGIRKVVGALRPALMRQFIGEAILMCFFAVLIAMAISFLLLPLFNSLTLKEIHLPFSSPIFWLILFVLAIATGILSGIYPALFISSFNPSRVLKGATTLSSGAVWFRKGLVVFQFALSAILIISTLIISRQVKYLQSKNLGYDKENLVCIPLEGNLATNYTLFKEKAQHIPGLKQVSRMGQFPTNIQTSTGDVQWEGKDPLSNPIITQVPVGYDFLSVMNIKLVDGRDFSEDFATDSIGYIINETALQKIGYKDPIGKSLTVWSRKGTIIGVVKDFHFNSLHVPINPIVMRLGEADNYGGALVRIEPGKTRGVLTAIENLCKELNPKFPFDYYFTDEEYAKLYTSEMVVGKLSNYFAFLAIFISCLGLLGLAIFTAEQRRKEISIRKVLGASIGSIFNLLSKDFTILVTIAIVISIPPAWWFINDWLQTYSYRAPIPWWIFAIAGVTPMVVALLTVSFQALRAAFANPITALRNE